MGSFISKKESAINSVNQVKPVRKPTTSADFFKWKKDISEIKLCDECFNHNMHISAYFFSTILLDKKATEICKKLYADSFGYFKAVSSALFNTTEEIYYTNDVPFEEVANITDPYVVITFIYNHTLHHNPLRAVFSETQCALNTYP